MLARFVVGDPQPAATIRGDEIRPQEGRLNGTIARRDPLERAAAGPSPELDAPGPASRFRTREHRVEHHELRDAERGTPIRYLHVVLVRMIGTHDFDDE